MPALGVATFQGVSGRSWAMTAVIGDGGARLVGGVLFIVPMVGFLLAAGGPADGSGLVAPGGGRLRGDLAAGDGALPAGVHDGRRPIGLGRW